MPSPATHPTGLPLTTFVARLIMPQREGQRQRLSLLCLDNRTGHAVHLDDKIMTPSRTCRRTR
jgi:hypothetical protein